MFDLFGSLFDGDRKRITFVTDSIPYMVVKHLEQHGVTTWPTNDIQRNEEDGTIEATILVNETQWKYAAGLVAGMGVALLAPMNVKPIAPRSNWGKPNRNARGPVASILRVLAG